MVVMTEDVGTCHIRCVKDESGNHRDNPRNHMYGCGSQSNRPGIASSDRGGDNDVLWDVARGASSLMVSSLAVVSNGTASDVAWLGMSHVMLGMSSGSSRASRLALSLDSPSSGSMHTVPS
jgi:hypothetical protein